MSLSNNSRFEGKVAIVTGATSGIGRTVAIGLANVGASVVVVGRRQQQGEAVVEQILKSGGKAAYFQADTSKEEDIEKMVQFTIQRFGRLDLAFNNAGVIGKLPTTEVTQEEYRRIFDTNVWGVLACMKHEIREMLKTGGGSIVNCSSIVGTKAFPDLQIYTASKHAVNGLTKSVALEYAKQGIRVNAIAPGPIMTEGLEKATNEESRNGYAAVVPQGRIGKEEEVIPPVLYLLDPANTFVTGTIATVDGGILA